MEVILTKVTFLRSYSDRSSLDGSNEPTISSIGNEPIRAPASFGELGIGLGDSRRYHRRNSFGSNEPTISLIGYEPIGAPMSFGEPVLIRGTLKMLSDCISE